MSIINEESLHESGACLTVSEREKGETRDPWRFIGIEIEGWERMTPVELRKLGHWLVHEGLRIGRKYKSNGQPKGQ